jgi:hypothetical protein
MRVFPSVDGSSARAELLEESARKTWDNGATARLLCSRSRVLSSVAFVGELL